MIILHGNLIATTQQQHNDEDNELIQLNLS